MEHSVQRAVQWLCHADHWQESLCAAIANYQLLMNKNRRLCYVQATSSALLYVSLLARLVGGYRRTLALFRATAHTEAVAACSSSLYTDSVNTASQLKSLYQG